MPQYRRWPVRPRRRAWSTDHALSIIRHDVPRRLDHDAVAALETVVHDLPDRPDPYAPSASHLFGEPDRLSAPGEAELPAQTTSL